MPSRMLLVALALVGLIGGSAQAANLRDGAGLFDLARFFDGASVSAGSIETLSLWHETFTASFEGRATAGRLELDEHFLFEDGPRLQRWRLVVEGPALSGTVSTERSDGTMSAEVPVSGQRTAKGAVLTYVGIPPGGGRFAFAFRHEMTVNADGTVANHVTVRKFGLRLAVSDVTFAKSPTMLQAHRSRP